MITKKILRRPKKINKHGQKDLIPQHVPKVSASPGQARILELQLVIAVSSSKEDTTHLKGGTDARDNLIYPGYLLRRGSRGEAVKRAQRLLNRHGNDLAVDGIFGPLTHAAVVQFQTSGGLTTDGIIGPVTWGALTSGGREEKEKPEDHVVETSKLQQNYERLLEDDTSPQVISEIITSLLGHYPAEQAVSGNALASQAVADRPWSGQQVSGLQALLGQVDAMMKRFAAGFQIGGVNYPLLGIRELNWLLRVAQEGKLHPAHKKQFPQPYLPLVPIILADDTLRKQVISAVQFLNMAEGYRRLIVGMIAMKQKYPQQSEALAQRMAFVHRAMSYIGAIESQADSGERAKATLDKEGYSSNPANKGKKMTKSEYPLRKGHKLFDQMWMEAVDEKYYSGNDRWGDVGQYGDHIRLLKTPKLPSWCGIYVTWIATQEGLNSSKWKMGGGNVDYKHWPNVYAGSQIPKKGLNPGDVLYAMSHFQHECIAISFDAATGMVTSIDGNTAPGGGVTGGQILVQERHYTFFSHVYPFRGKSTSKP